MKLLDHLQIRSDLPWTPSAMRLGRDTPRMAVALEKSLEKAQTHSKKGDRLIASTESGLY